MGLLKEPCDRKKQVQARGKTPRSQSPIFYCVHAFGAAYWVFQQPRNEAVEKLVICFLGIVSKYRK
jgi:hypothetical protein